MDSNSGQTISIWMAIAEEPELVPLGENMHTDVCIVGAGIAGKRKLPSARYRSQGRGV